MLRLVAKEAKKPAVLGLEVACGSGLALCGSHNGWGANQIWLQIFQAQAMAYSSGAKQSLLNSAPASLAAERVIAEPRPGVEQNFFTRAVLKIAGFYSQESQQLMAAKAWYTAVTEQAEDRRLYKAFDLDWEKYRDKYAMLCIHMWMTLVRLRSEGKPGKDLTQKIYDNFQDDVEHRVREAGVKVRVSKHLADQEQIFFGTGLAYDQAVDGGEPLSSALLRNIYQKRPEMKTQADFLARYVTRELACLAMTDSESVMNGRVKFSNSFLK